MPTHCRRRAATGCRCRRRSAFRPRRGCVLGVPGGPASTPATIDTSRSAARGFGTTIAVASFGFPTRWPFYARSKLRRRALGTDASQLFEGSMLAATEQLRSQHLAVDPAHTGELLGTISSTIVVKGGQGLWPLVADQPGGPFLALAQGLSQLRGGRHTAECLGQFCLATPSRSILLGPADRQVHRTKLPRRRRTDIGANPIQRVSREANISRVVKAHHRDRERNATLLKQIGFGKQPAGRELSDHQGHQRQVGRDEPPPRPVALLLDQLQLCSLSVWHLGPA